VGFRGRLASGGAAPEIAWTGLWGDGYGPFGSSAPPRTMGDPYRPQS
jgi:hypothetical protein